MSSGSVKLRAIINVETLPILASIEDNFLLKICDSEIFIVNCFCYRPQFQIDDKRAEPPLRIVSPVKVSRMFETLLKPKPGGKCHPLDV